MLLDLEIPYQNDVIPITSLFSKVDCLYAGDRKGPFVLRVKLTSYSHLSATLGGGR